MIECFEVCKSTTTGKYFLLCLPTCGKAEIVEGEFKTFADAEVAADICLEFYRQGYSDGMERKENQHTEEFENLLSNISGLIERTNTNFEELSIATGIKELESKLNGVFPLTLDETKRIADFFKVSIDDLIYKKFC